MRNSTKYDRDLALYYCAVIAVQFSISAKDILSRCQTAAVARPRQVAMWTLRDRLGMTLQELAEFFGRDRTTIVYGCGAVRDRLKTDEEFRLKWRELSARVLAAEKHWRDGKAAA